jgi:hypothetical protein
MFPYAMRALIAGVCAIVTVTQLVGQSPPDTVQVAPGITVPSKGSVWAIDSAIQEHRASRGPRGDEVNHAQSGVLRASSGNI